jgi:hypothetical protein
MKKVFYVGIVLWLLFELANVYFVMPLPLSQRIRSIDVAYFLYSWRWVFRGLIAAMLIGGAPAIWRGSRRHNALALASLLITGAVVYVIVFKMSADRMFLQPDSIVLRRAQQSVVEPARLVVGVDINGDARAYPVQFLGYHHQVRDVVSGTPILVSFCTVCRTGRVFSPTVDGRVERFRLVGMDHFNAMFEDERTKSWWRQATGESVAGPRRGRALTELPSLQVTLAEWLALHPNSLIMQPDSALQDNYSKGFGYETGTSRKALTGTDTVPWHDKAWVVGITVNGQSKAYDWHRLRRERTVNDELGGKSIVLTIASDDASFFAFERPDQQTRFTMRSDSLVAASGTYALSGRGSSSALRAIFASQEFWHSWRTFHPGTEKY